jgi:hypothetical protein
MSKKINDLVNKVIITHDIHTFLWHNIAICNKLNILVWLERFYLLDKQIKASP